MTTYRVEGQLRPTRPRTRGEWIEVAIYQAFSPQQAKRKAEHFGLLQGQFVKIRAVKIVVDKSTEVL